MSFFDVRVPLTTRYKLWSEVAANVILDSDPRYACIPLYRRDPAPSSASANTVGASSATVFLVPIRARNTAIFHSIPVGPYTSDLLGPSAAATTNMANLNPTLMQMTASAPTAGNPDGPFITFNKIYDKTGKLTGATPKATALAATDEDSPLAPGAYVIVSDCNLLPQKNGQIYKLGARIDPTTVTSPTYYIAPDPQGANDVYATLPIPFPGFTANAFVVGRGISAPGSGTGTTFDGPNQALGIVPVTIQLKH
jgi:hypothetical protein